MAILPRLAAAQNAEERAVAEHAFVEGRRLMSQGRYLEACEKFARSHALDPSVGALLNEANCREKLGQIATAWTLFRDAERRAHKTGDKKRARLARRRARALNPLLSYLTIKVPPQSRVEGLMIYRNGQPLAAATWNQRIPADPGEYEIRAEAANHQTWTTKTGVGANGEHAVVEIPRLPLSAHREREKPDPAPAPDSGGAATAGQPDGVAGQGAAGSAAATDNSSLGPRADARPASSDSPWPIDRKIALGAASAGAALVVASGVLALQSRRAKSRAREDCDADFRVCGPEGVSALEDAHSWRNYSIVTLAVGAVAIGTGAFLWFRSSPGEDRESSTKTARVIPVVHETGGAVLIQGRF